MLESSTTYPGSPVPRSVRTRLALVKAWCWSVDSRPASRKWRTVKYDSPPIRMERISAPSPNTAVMRAPMPNFTSGHQLVAHAPHGENVLGHRGIHLDLGAQAADMHVDQASVAEVVVAPDPVEQLLTAQHLVGAGRQLAEQAEFCPGAVHLFPVEAPQDPLLGQQLQVAEGQRARFFLRRPGPAPQGADAANLSRPSAPLAASLTSYPSPSRASRMEDLIRSSSSTTRMRPLICP